MALLFADSVLADLVLRNRTFRSATCEGLADKDGFVHRELIRLIAELARNSVGMVVTGCLYVSPEGRGYCMPGEAVSARGAMNCAHDPASRLKSC